MISIFKYPYKPAWCKKLQPETPDCQTGISCLEYTHSKERAPVSWRIPMEHPNPVSAQQRDRHQVQSTVSFHSSPGEAAPSGEEKVNSGEGNPIHAGHTDTAPGRASQRTLFSPSPQSHCISKKCFVVLMELCFEKKSLKNACHLDWHCLLKRF